jgi:type II secretory pathway component GspD/PulD (secretin)
LIPISKLLTLMMLLSLTWAHGTAGGDALKMYAEIYPLGLADFEVSEQLAKEIVSSDGKLVGDRERNRLILFDTAERHAALKQALNRVQGPRYHVRVVVQFQEERETQSKSLGVDLLRSDPSVDANLAHSTSSSLVQQELLVVSGGRAHLRIGENIPYEDWIWTYGCTHGFWKAGVKWQQVGARLVVEPYVLNDSTIRLRLTPEFSYLLGGERLDTAVQQLSTEIIAENGREVVLGGTPASHQDFYSRFLVGYSHLGEKKSLRIVLKPTIEPL